MLTNLYIRHYAIIDEIQLDFQNGMSCLTGETGAGKSILLGALGLVLGDRAEPSNVKHGHPNADISAVFDISELSALKQQLHDLDLDSDDECILRRIVKKEGASKAYINGHPVTVSVLKTIGTHLIRIHGQHAHQTLLNKDTQRQRLDDFGAHHTALKEVEHAYTEWKQTQKKLEDLTTQQSQLSERKALLEFQIDAFEQLNPQEGEWSSIQAEHQLLAHSERFLSTIDTALDDLSDGNSSHPITLTLSKHIQSLEDIADLDQRITPTLDTLRSALIDIEEACSNLRSYQSNIDLDPNRLAFLDERMSVMHGLAKKHNIDPEQLYVQYQTLLTEYKALENTEEDVDLLSSKLDELTEKFKEKSFLLHKLRKESSSKLSRKITTAMQTLGMEGGRFEVSLEKDEEQFSPHGQDNIQFLVSTNPGQPLQTLGRVASGGELSRISLAIQMMTAQSESVPTLIFDEVDAGIGGGIAEVVGKTLRTLSEQGGKTQDTHQVLCVTHLAQVACQGHHHFNIIKTKHASETHTNVTLLNQEERIQEIARMLGGKTLSEATLAHAKDMLHNS